MPYRHVTFCFFQSNFLISANLGSSGPEIRQCVGFFYDGMVSDREGEKNARFLGLKLV